MLLPRFGAAKSEQVSWMCSVAAAGALTAYFVISLNRVLGCCEGERHCRDSCRLGDGFKAAQDQRSDTSHNSSRQECAISLLLAAWSAAAFA